MMASLAGLGFFSLSAGFSMGMLRETLVLIRLGYRFSPGQIRENLQLVVLDAIALSVATWVTITMVRSWIACIAIGSVALVMSSTSYVIMIRSNRPPRRRLRDRARAKLRRLTAWRPPVLQPAGAR